MTALLVHSSSAINLLAGSHVLGHRLPPCPDDRHRSPPGYRIAPRLPLTVLNESRRIPADPHDAEAPLTIVADGNFARGHRLSRRGVRHVVDGYLRSANVKRPRVSNHALRHTSATLAYRYTRDLRAVQDMLGHQDPKTTARYARVVDRAQSNPALKVPVEL